MSEIPGGWWAGARLYTRASPDDDLLELCRGRFAELAALLVAAAAPERQAMSIQIENEPISFGAAQVLAMTRQIDFPILI